MPSIPKSRALRRTVAVIVCLSPLALLLLSLASPASIQPVRHGFAIALASMALVIGATNFWLSFVRPPLHRRRSPGIYKHVSGLPLVGTLLILLAALAGFGSLPVAALGLVVLTIDTGGSPWLLFAIWRDRTFLQEGASQPSGPAA